VARTHEIDAHDIFGFTRNGIHFFGTAVFRRELLLVLNYKRWHNHLGLYCGGSAKHFFKREGQNTNNNWASQVTSSAIGWRLSFHAKAIDHLSAVW